MTITTVVVDDHPALRVGVVHVLDSVEDIVVAGEAGDGHQLWRTLEALATPPDVLLLDLSMPDFSIFRTLPKLRRQYPDMCILIVSMEKSKDYVLRVVKAGIDGYLLKEEPLDVYPVAVRQVAEGKTFYSQDIMDIVLAKDGGKPVLSEREREVLELAAGGFTRDEIADHLYVSRHTVKFHLSNIHKKLKVVNRAQAIKRAVELGILPPQGR